MNPLTNVKNIQKLNQRELELGVDLKHSWHQQYRDSAWVFIGGLNYDLTEGDIVCVFSQYGEIVNINLVRDKKTGKSKGFAFLCYEDQRSTILAVDNLNGIKLATRIIRVDHVEEYKVPKMSENMSAEQQELIIEGCAPQETFEKQEQDKTPPLLQESSIKKEKEERVRIKKEKKRKNKKKNRESSTSSSSSSDTSSSGDDSESGSSRKKKQKQIRRRNNSTSEDSEYKSDKRNKRRHKKKREDYESNVTRIKEEKTDPGYEKYEFNCDKREHANYSPRERESMSRSHNGRDASNYRNDGERYRKHDQGSNRGHSKIYERDRDPSIYYDDYKRHKDRSRSKERYRERR